MTDLLILPERQTFIVLPRMGQNFPKGKFQRRLCRRRMPLKAAKGFHWIVRICCLCALIRGLRNLGAPLKGFNCCGAKLPLRCADSRFAKPRKFPKGRRVYSFCIVQKEPKSTPEVCEPLDSGNDSNRRSTRCFC